jgi:hypothetical protein
MANFALARTPMYDANGNMTRQWVLYFNSLGGGGASSSSGSAVTITVAGGVATPDLSQGTIFILVMTADTTLALPANVPSGSTPWALIVQQDTAGKHSLLTPDYPMNYSIATGQSPASTESIQTFITDSSGNTRATGAPALDQPIP